MKQNTRQIEEARFQKTQALMEMFAERYLDLESSESNKMSLEITTSWECKTIVL